MSKSVKRIKVIVTFDNGDEISQTLENPTPQGANPRFMVRQFAEGMKVILPKIGKMIEAMSPGQWVPED